MNLALQYWQIDWLSFLVLPVESIYLELVNRLKTHKINLLQAPPGAGKSTWLPLQLMRDNVFGKIVMLEPRRLAARNIANYLASCQQEPLGQSIGLRIRNEHICSKATRLEIVTEGVLTRMLQQDPELTGIDCLIFDEFHERSLAADTALAFALESQMAFRDDLSILIMSATLDSQKIADTLGCDVLTTDGRTFPISEHYWPVADESQWLVSLVALVKHVAAHEVGSCLVFLPGQKEIKYIHRALTDLDPLIEVHVLFGEQNKQQQEQAIAPIDAPKRKIVLTTNVAQTSLTIEGITVVIDSGRQRLAKFNLKTGVTELVTAQISRAAAIQRAGRAGRLSHGKVFRLGTVAQFERRESHDQPEILSCDISQLLLETAQWGAELNDLTLLDKPTVAQRQQAWQLLLMLEAIDQQHKITAMGQKMLSFGTDLRLAHMLIKAEQLDCDYAGIHVLAVYLVALFESRSYQEVDLAQALHNRHNLVQPQFKQFLNAWLRRFKFRAPDELRTEYLGILVALAYPDRIAKKRGKGYLLANGAGADLCDDAFYQDEYIAIAQLGGVKGSRIFSAAPVAMSELQSALPHLFNWLDVCDFDDKLNRFIAEQRLMLGAVCINTKAVVGEINKTQRSLAWQRLVTERGISLFNDYEACQQFLVRLSLAGELFSEVFSHCSESWLISNQATWLAPYLADIKNYDQLQKLNLHNALGSLLNWQQMNQLNTLLPSKLVVPSGSTIGLTYQLSGPVKLSVRMQEVYGWLSSPQIAQGKLAVLLELLSPAGRPLQLTQDLAGFWQGSYKEVQKEMKGRYPKHFWPDDPAISPATNRVKSRM
ncbi:ATP-dependent helicase [Pseudoalteromonas tunicata D2]|uniref:ATP-dependent helicase n=1 Tax=Pseudoalteromonas tunicata D2 TaxID=87626 RepID=A4C6V2_9GAMM|nr:ATP-dependent helicase [Pseudoalteromonas tunicata D2]